MMRILPRHLCPVLALLLCHCSREEEPPIRILPPSPPLAEGAIALSSTAAQALIDSTPGLQIVDVRQEHEFRSGHLAGARHANAFTEDVARERLEALDRDQPCLIYCELGGRSRRMTPLLEDLGFTQVYWLEGGLAKWRELGFPITPAEEVPSNTAPPPATPR